MKVFGIKKNVMSDSLLSHQLIRIVYHCICIYSTNAGSLDLFLYFLYGVLLGSTLIEH